jgi:hypothetical protein
MREARCLAPAADPRECRAAPRVGQRGGHTAPCRVPRRVGSASRGVCVVEGARRGGCASWREHIAGGGRRDGRGALQCECSGECARGGRGEFPGGKGRGGCECGCGWAASIRCEHEKESSWPFAGHVSQASRRTWILASTKACPGPGTLPARDPSRSLRDAFVPSDLGHDSESEGEAAEAPQPRTVEAICKANWPTHERPTKACRAPWTGLRSVVLRMSLLGRGPSFRRGDVTRIEGAHWKGPQRFGARVRGRGGRGAVATHGRGPSKEGCYLWS